MRHFRAGPLTAHVETRAGQDVSVRGVTHQVVSGLLPGAAEVVQRDAQGAGAHHAVGAAGQTHPVQGPVQGAGVEAQLGAQRARGCQAGADAQDGILRGDDCYFWVVETGTDSTLQRPRSFSFNAPLFTSRFHLMI